MPHVIIKLMILVAWFSQAQGLEIYPAKIYLGKSEGTLEFTCSTYGLQDALQRTSKFHIYLCRNGVGIKMKLSWQDATFCVDDTRRDNTGYYSCVYSVQKYNIDQVRQNGTNSIFVSVNDSFVPAEIASSQTHVITGSDVEFQCTSLNLPERNHKGNIYAVLYKNSTVIQMNIWDMRKNKARFVLKEVRIQDAGKYICFLMSEPLPFPKNVYGVNEVILDVTVSEYFNETIKITVGVLSLLLIILILGLVSWGVFQKKGCFKGHSDRFDISVEHSNHPREAEMNQAEMRNVHSFDSEWDQTSSSSASPSYTNTYQVCEDQ
ncbi:uncharacterized protein LOC131351595 isoform X2 [Hemibagrus wyckioides]|uniref:uncharacterized protein LOC131351595 isoform X2 n=1 Tax=Hemibagrus wyckioides TaxID=337641 RepID=UPI00266BC81A|nr:uncharacterized protein LOC131351595 isoform X2 [Hemibagrus wyckioides]